MQHSDIQSTSGSTRNDSMPTYSGRKVAEVMKGVGIPHSERLHYSPSMVEKFRTIIQHVKENVVIFDVVAAAEQMAGINPGTM